MPLTLLARVSKTPFKLLSWIGYKEKTAKHKQFGWIVSVWRLKESRRSG